MCALQVPLPTLNGHVVELMLQYLYAGHCLFPHDDLNLGLDLMATADQYFVDDMKEDFELFMRGD